VNVREAVPEVLDGLEKNSEVSGKSPVRSLRSPLGSANCPRWSRGVFYIAGVFEQDIWRILGSIFFHLQNFTMKHCSLCLLLHILWIVNLDVAFHVQEWAMMRIHSSVVRVFQLV
jgi:hypothetical protein